MDKFDVTTYVNVDGVKTIVDEQTVATASDLEDNNRLTILDNSSGIMV